MWLEHTRRSGWKAVAAVEVPSQEGHDQRSRQSRPMLGVAYGYCGAPDQWWQQQVVAGLHRVGADSTRIAELMTSYFELTELHIHPRAQGRGLGEALARRLLADRGESHVLLSTPEINGEANRAWRLYRRLGFTDVIRGYHFAGDPRPFAILGRTCPCNAVRICPPRPGVWHDDRRARPPVPEPPQNASARARCCCWSLCHRSPVVCGSGPRSPCRRTTRVSGQIIAAAKPRRCRRQGPTAAQQPAVRQQGRGLRVQPRRLRRLASDVLRPHLRRTSPAGEHEP